MKGPDGGLVDRFPTAQFFDKIGVHQESWTYEPFTYLRSGDWPGLDDGNRAQLFFVGPLARLNVADQLDTSLAEAERQRLAETLGPFPRYGVPAAYEALSVELLRAVEKFEGLCKQEQLTGPSIRTIPSEMGREVVAAIEAPEGTIAHRYRVDGHGIVEDVEILDPAAHNNALKCLLTRTIVSAALEANKDLRETKACIELSLLPF